MKRPILSGVLLLLSISAGSQSQAQNAALAIAVPASGSLSQERLAEVAADIRRLEANPYAPDAADARRALFQWVSASPDVHVSLCEGVTKELMDSKSKYKSELFLQFLLSSAAYGAENFEQAGNEVALNLSGLRGALKTYTILKKNEGKSVRDRYLDHIERLDNDGKLEQWVTKAVQKCSSR